MLQDVETKKHRVDDLTHQREELAAQQLGYGKNSPSPSADIGKLSLEVQRAQRELDEVQARVNKYIDPKAEKAQNELSHAQNERHQARHLGSGQPRLSRLRRPRGRL
jgi:cell pole-organizing protein PopZ